MSYENLTVSIEHHFTQNFLIRKITRHAQLIMVSSKMDTLFLWHNRLFFLHANIERVNGGFVVFSPFNSTLEMQQIMGDFVRLCLRVGVLGAKKISAIRSTKNRSRKIIGLQILYEYT